MFHKLTNVENYNGAYARKLNQKVLVTVSANSGLSANEIVRKNTLLLTASTVRRIFLPGKQPNRTLKEKFVTKTRARKRYQQILTKYQGCLLIDNKTYVKMNFGQLPGQYSTWRLYEEVILQSLSLLLWTNLPKNWLFGKWYVAVEQIPKAVEHIPKCSWRKSRWTQLHQGRMPQKTALHQSPLISREMLARFSELPLHLGSHPAVPL